LVKNKLSFDIFTERIRSSSGNQKVNIGSWTFRPSGEIFVQLEVFVLSLLPGHGIVLYTQLFFHRVDVEQNQSLFGEVRRVKENHGDVIGASWTAL